MLRMTLLLLFLTNLSCIPQQNLIYSNFDNDQFAIESSSYEKEYLLGMNHLKNNELGLACEKFSALSENERFLFVDLFKIRKFQSCQTTEKDIENFINSIPKQVKLFEQLALSKAIEKTGSASQLRNNLFLRFSNLGYLNSKNDRVRELIKIVDLAKNSNDPNYKKYFSKLVELAPRFAKKITKENIYLYARDLERVRNFEQARKLYQKIIKSRKYDYNLKIKAWNSFRMSFKVERKLSEYLKQTQNFINYLSKLRERNPRNPQYKKDYVDYKIILVRAYWTENKNQIALTMLKDLMDENVSNSNQIARNYWIQGRIYKEEKENENALEYFRKAANKNISDASLAESVYWDLSWSLYLQGRYQEAADFLKQSRKYVSSESALKKFSFWQAMSLKKLGQITEADELFYTLSSRYSFDYYGLLSKKELLIPVKPFQIPKDREVYNSAKFKWFGHINETKIALKYLKELYKNVSSEKRITVLPLFHEVNEYRYPLQRYFNLPSRYRSNDYLDMIYPSPFLSQYQSAETKFNVSAYYLLAISRQESIFDRYARSWADAFGVMQIIPERAKSLSKKYNIPYSSYEDLYDADINIQMGAAMLGELKQTLNYKFVLHTSSYNAAMSAVKRWYRTRFTGDYVEFIENIPYTETRNYNKLVLRNYFNYKRINESQEFIFTDDFFTSDI